MPRAAFPASFRDPSSVHSSSAQMEHSEGSDDHVNEDYGRSPRDHTSRQYSQRDPSLTIREKRKDALNARRRDPGAVSRASLVHGSNPTSGDSWYDVEAFMLDQVREVLGKLSDGSIDDEIWGKIVIMERCKRVAKAYLRKTTVIVDGSEEEFDGRTLGFNAFDNSQRDDHTKEIRAKIGDGVILKMDLQGNIKGMARGAAPVVCQGWRGERNNCVSDRLIRQQGRLNATTAGEEGKAYKMFDMKKFKHSLDRDLMELTSTDAKGLMLKTCLRVALVKDGADMARTPCWFAVVNLVALDMLKEKIPNLSKLVCSERPLPRSSGHSTRHNTIGGALSQEALSQIIAAAVSQVNHGTYQGMPSSLPMSPDQIAQLASSLSLAGGNLPPQRQEPNTINKKDRSRKSYHCSSSSLESSGEDSLGLRSIEKPIKMQRPKRWETSSRMASSGDTFYDSGLDKTREKDKKKPMTPRGGVTSSARPRLADVMFTRSQSITSDYDSNREHFDSGSWSSAHSHPYKGGRSTASSMVSEPELVMLERVEETRDEQRPAREYSATRERTRQRDGEEERASVREYVEARESRCEPTLQTSASSTGNRARNGSTSRRPAHTSVPCSATSIMVGTPSPPPPQTVYHQSRIYDQPDTGFYAPPKRGGNQPVEDVSGCNVGADAPKDVPTTEYMSTPVVNSYEVEVEEGDHPDSSPDHPPPPPPPPPPPAPHAETPILSPCAPKPIDISIDSDEAAGLPPPLPPPLLEMLAPVQDDDSNHESSMAALNGSVMQRNIQSRPVQSWSGPQMEVRQQTMPRPPRNPFFSELRQVLHKRSAAVRLPRNLSQPSHVGQQWRDGSGVHGISSCSAAPPTLQPASSSRTLCSTARGLRRTPASPQQQHRYAQRLSRTASLPFGQWEQQQPQPHRRLM